MATLTTALAAGSGRNPQRLVTAPTSNWRMLKTSGIIWHLQGRGIRWGFSTLDSLPRAVGQRVGEEPGLENHPPQKICFPCDLNDNSSCPASWLDWEASFSPCYPIIQTTHVYLKWSLLYISCQPRYTFNSKEGVNWQRCKKMVFCCFSFCQTLTEEKKLCKSRQKC